MKHLIVLLGPTGIGKTDLSLNLAKALGAEIVSSDSRQVYKELNIGTAVPKKEQLSAVPHHFIGNKSIHDYYNVSMYEVEVMQCLDELFKSSDFVVLVGGSGMYIDVVCDGIDELPDVDQELRIELQQRFEKQGIEQIRSELKIHDPEFYNIVDLNNGKRLLKALEVCYQTGKPYSFFRTGKKIQRPFNIIKIGLQRDRDELYARINLRVEQMLDEGLIDEAKGVHHYRTYNSLNTVGYKELFAHFEGEYDVAKAIELIQRNSRRYAKRQITWFKRDQSTTWFHPQNEVHILEEITKQINQLQ